VQFNPWIGEPGFLCCIINLVGEGVNIKHLQIGN